MGAGKPTKFLRPTRMRAQHREQSPTSGIQPLAPKHQSSRSLTYKSGHATDRGFEVPVAIRVLFLHLTYHYGFGTSYRECRGSMY
ncbi:Hypothetical predicted protein [Pelobates cultripes]|uniref:Uncharacterized protein n=1 Tax=Pelobates cultripes TaxID=61616 RepID=A0AAD1WM23_PELCU|nr:Hypothetical predicted protein [Pelobates cultripes]